MKIKLLNLHSLPIFEQLQIEEALLRCDEDNYCIINTNAQDAIVMGISGKVEKLVNLQKTTNIPIIKRFSGGGTVYIDPETIFVTFIGSFPNVQPYPIEILKWSESIYKPVFPFPFALRENDFVIGDKKIGGNAQYIRQKRWLLHTSFLWNFSKEKMDCLLHPEKTPPYRQNRTHLDFLTTLSQHYQNKTTWLNTLKSHLKSAFEVTEISLSDTSSIMSIQHRKSTTYI